MPLLPPRSRDHQSSFGLTADGRRPLTVGELCALLRDILDEAFPEIVFEGEISEAKAGKTGHVYFTVKDPNSQVSCVMWAGTARTLGFPITPGMTVLCYSKPTIYQPRGSLQLIVHRMIQGGEGVLRQKFLALKEKLDREGYFSQTRKRPLPFFPAAVGIVTSKSGAVIHDIMVKIRERMPSLKVYLVDVKVQGDGAAQEIARGIKQLSDSKLVEVIIVARGGGSLEDLWAFNEEAVVKAIFASAVPVISGVGHEVDVSLSDYVADVRAPTPTAAAEMVVPHREELLRQLDEYHRRLSDTERWLFPLSQRLDDLVGRLERRTRSNLREAELHLAQAARALKTIAPRTVIQGWSARLSLLEHRLIRKGRSDLSARERLLVERRNALVSSVHPERWARLRQHLASVDDRLSRSVRRTVVTAGERCETLGHRLRAASPQAVLERGYSIVRSSRGIVKDGSEVTEGDALAIQLARGSVAAIVSDCKGGEGIKWERKV